ncbi:MAG: hypothetical protein JWN84_4220 [Nocardioides sp.]|jgi:hypothetical protein|nr:hypothetical protein [Nocardioides sp.]
MTATPDEPIDDPEVVVGTDDLTEPAPDPDRIAPEPEEDVVPPVGTDPDGS